jgi:hypothetical protein
MLWRINVVTLPADFVATKYTGYFWNLKEQKLYSIKVDGILKPIKKYPPNQWNHFVDAYRVSVKGHRRALMIDYLKKLVPSNSVIPLEK